MTRDMNLMIAVASGSRTQVRRWVEALRLAAIEYFVAEGTDLPELDGAIRIEVWVAREDADEARDSLRRSEKEGDPNLW